MQNVILKSGNQSENVSMENLLTLLDKTQNVKAQTLESKILASQIQDVANKMEILPTGPVLPSTKPQTANIIVKNGHVGAKILNLRDASPQNSQVTVSKKTILQLSKNS